MTSVSATASRVRIVVTVLATVLVVVGEFALLSLIYQRGQPTRDQRLVVAAVAGQWDVVASPVSTTVLDQTGSQLAHLRRLGLSAGRIAPIQADLATVRSNPADPSALARTRTDLHSLATALAKTEDGIDTQAEIIYVIVLVTVSLGWMIWFRRLVNRHRVAATQPHRRGGDGRRRAAAGGTGAQRGRRGAGV